MNSGIYRAISAPCFCPNLHCLGPGLLTSYLEQGASLRYIAGQVSSISQPGSQGPCLC